MVVSLVVLVIAIALDIGLIYWLRKIYRPRAVDAQGHAGGVYFLGSFSPLLTWLRDGVAKIARKPAKKERTHKKTGRAFPPGFPASWKSFWREEMAGNERRALQIVVVCACILVNLFLGYAYEKSVMVNGWQLGVWLAGIFLTALVLIPPRAFSIRPRKIWLAFLALFVAAFLLRGLFLEKLPAGLHSDESGTADFALRYVFPGGGQTLNPFRSGGNSQPTLFNYIIRISLFVFGNSKTGLRLPGALAGSLGVLATYFLVSIAQNRRTAWLAAIVMAAYQYAIHWSRLGLNNIWATLWIPLTLALYLWGWRVKWNGAAVLAGLALGLSVYFYTGGLIIIFLLAFVIFDLWRKESDHRRLAIHTGKMLAAAACVAAPLVAFAVAEPVMFFDRSRTVFAWTPQFIAQVTGSSTAYFKFFWFQLVHSFGAFTAYEDTSGFYAPGIPFLIGLAAPLAAIGTGWAVYKKQSLFLIWLVTIVVLGGILLTATPAGSHMIASIPVICWAIGMALNWLMEIGWKKWALVILVLVVLTDLTFYFVIYPAVPHGDLNMPFPPLP